jgi:hypothetical protein
MHLEMAKTEFGDSSIITSQSSDHASDTLRIDGSLSQVIKSRVIGPSAQWLIFAKLQLGRQLAARCEVASTTQIGLQSAQGWVPRGVDGAQSGLTAQMRSADHGSFAEHWSFTNCVRISSSRVLLAAWQT